MLKMGSGAKRQESPFACIRSPDQIPPILRAYTPSGAGVFCLNSHKS